MTRVQSRELAYAMSLAIRHLDKVPEQDEAGTSALAAAEAILRATFSLVAGDLDRN